MRTDAQLGEIVVAANQSTMLVETQEFSMLSFGVDLHSFGIDAMSFEGDLSLKDLNLLKAGKRVLGPASFAFDTFEIGSGYYSEGMEGAGQAGSRVGGAAAGAYLVGKAGFRIAGPKGAFVGAALGSIAGGWLGEEAFSSRESMLNSIKERSLQRAGSLPSDAWIHK